MGRVTGPPNVSVFDKSNHPAHKRANSVVGKIIAVRKKFEGVVAEGLAHLGYKPGVTPKSEPGDAKKGQKEIKEVGPAKHRKSSVQWPQGPMQRANAEARREASLRGYGTEAGVEKTVRF